MTTVTTRVASVSTSSGESGFVLISVLWIAGLLALVALVFSLNLRAQLQLKHNLADAAKAKAISEGLSRLAALQIAADPGNAKGNGAVTFCNWGDGITAGVAVQDQGGLIDLNTASPLLLRALIEGATGADADEAVNDIQDFKDPDHTAAQGGEEPDPYPGTSFGPKNDAFSAIEELDQVPSLRGQPYQQLKHYVTVQSQQPGVDPVSLPEGLQAVLARGGLSDLSQVSAPSPRKAFAINIAIKMRSGLQSSWAATIVLTQQPGRPYATVAWSRSDQLPEGWPEPSTLSPCFN